MKLFLGISGMAFLVYLVMATRNEMTKILPGWNIRSWD